MSDGTPPERLLADIVASATKAKYEIPLVFLQEIELFGKRIPTREEWLGHVELYKALANKIDPSHIKGLQRIRGLWRVYLDNLEDKVKLMSDGVPLRGKIIPVLNTNPNRLDGENTTRVRVKNLPLSVDDDVIVRTLTLMKLEVISHYREKLRINDKLTNCETGDRLIIVKTSTLKVPLPNFMSFGKHTGRVLHFGQHKADNRPKKCSKCLQEGHVFSSCPNDWVCMACSKSGHKRSECPINDKDDPKNDHEDDSCDSEAGSESDAKSQHSSDDSDDNESVKLTSTADLFKKTTDMASGGEQFIDSTITPNKGRKMNAHVRSPPTPAEELRDKQYPGKGSKKLKKKK